MNYLKELFRYWWEIIAAARTKEAAYAVVLFLAYFAVIKMDWRSAAWPEVKEWAANDWALLAFALSFEVVRNVIIQPFARYTLQVTPRVL